MKYKGNEFTLKPKELGKTYYNEHSFKKSGWINDL